MGSGGGFVREWVFTTDHKRIGIQFLAGSFAVFIIAGVMAFMIRIEQSYLGPTLTDNPTTYNVWLYFHGAAMILAYLIPALTGFFGNYLVPLMIGAREMAFPRLNALSLWLFWLAIVTALLTFVVPDPPDVMWTGYVPYAVTSPGNTALYIITVLLLGFSAIIGAVNIITTIHFMRALGMTYFQMNMFVWTILAALVDQLVFVPVLAASMILLMLDRYFGTSFFNPASGGDVLIYQNLFWFYSHPAVYVIMLPSIGILFDIVATMAKNRVFNYRIAVIAGIWGTLILAGEVWIHHLYVTGMPDWIRTGIMMATLLISVPVGLLTVSLWGTLYRGAITYNTAMIYALGAMFLFLAGGLTGIPVGINSTDIHLSETSFVHAHFHFVMALFSTFAIFGGIYYWFPKMTGRMVDERLGKAGFWLNFAGSNITFWPLLLIGVEGMPRRYWDYPMLPELEPMHKLATLGAIIFALGILVTIYSWISAAIKGPKAPENPWGSVSLEWTHAPNNPPHGNFAERPEVSEDWSPYDYFAGIGSRR